MSQFEHGSHAGCFGGLPMMTILAAAAALSWPPRLRAAHQLQVRAVTISGDCISKGPTCEGGPFDLGSSFVGWNTGLT